MDRLAAQRSKTPLVGVYRSAPMKDQARAVGEWHGGCEATFGHPHPVTAIEFGYETKS